MSVSVIICAAGKGTRTGFSHNKILAPYQGIPVLERTITAFLLPEITQILVAYSPDDEAEMQSFARKYPIHLVEGGTTRTETVYKALQRTNGEIVQIGRAHV